MEWHRRWCWRRGQLTHGNVRSIGFHCQHCMPWYDLQRCALCVWCPVLTQISYNDMKSKIEGLLSLKPACAAAHVGATLQATLAGGVVEGVAPASCELSTLWGKVGRRGVGWAAADRPGAPLLAPPFGWGARAGSREEGRNRSRSVGGTSYH